MVDVIKRYIDDLVHRILTKTKKNETTEVYKVFDDLATESLETLEWTEILTLKEQLKDVVFPNKKSVSYFLYLLSSSKNILLSICGLAFPFVAFIACPTKNPSALSFPAL